MGERRHSSPTRKRLALDEKKRKEGRRTSINAVSPLLALSIHQLYTLAVMRPVTWVKLYSYLLVLYEGKRSNVKRITYAGMDEEKTHAPARLDLLPPSNIAVNNIIMIHHLLGASMMNGHQSRLDKSVCSAMYTIQKGRLSWLCWVLSAHSTAVSCKSDIISRGKEEKGRGVESDSIIRRLEIDEGASLTMEDACGWELKLF